MKLYPILLSSVLLLCGCQQYPDTTFDANEKSKVKITVSKGSPLDTKVDDGTFASYTVKGEVDDFTTELYVIDKFITSELIETATYLEDGTQLSTGIVYHGKVVSYEVVMAIEDILENGPIDEVEGKGWWRRFRACVNTKANEMHENINSSPLDRATCEWVPCETFILVAAAFDCLVN